MRARILKPGFFKNEDLAALNPLSRILFAGLWCLSDREGRMEDRPRRIKVDALAYDDCDIEALLGELVEAGFIRRYELNGARFIQVVNFLRHQTPHVKEPVSAIPPPADHCASLQPALYLNETGPVLDADEVGVGTSPTHQSLNPESLTEAEYRDLGRAGAKPRTDPQIDEVYAYFKKRIQPGSRFCPREKIAARLKEMPASDLKLGIDHFADDEWRMKHNGTQGAAWFFRSRDQAEKWLLLQPQKAAAQRSNVVTLRSPQPAPKYSNGRVLDDSEEAVF